MGTNTSSITHQGLGSLFDVGIPADTLEQVLIEAEREIARQRAIQLTALECLDRAQVSSTDGSRTLAHWVAARLDIDHHTADDLVRTMRRTAQRPALRRCLGVDGVSFPRVSAAARIADPEVADPLYRHLDIAGVRREAARRACITPEQEQRSSLDQFLVIQPSPDESWWRVFGGLDGATGAIVDKALADAADRLPEDDHAPHDSSWRRAVALAQVCLGDETSPTQISVFVDADLVSTTRGQAGIYLEAGPRIGRQTLEALLCDSVTEVTMFSGEGKPMHYGRRSRTIPPALRRAVIRRDGNRCVIDGCDSRNRLQVHHIIPWSRGGPTDPENLMTVCWYHHHVAIHRHRLEPYRHPTHGRYRLRPTVRPPPG
jgi:hypothetical protein